MKNLLSKMKGDYVTSAKVVDGTLILSAPDALSPVVWRWDLGQVASSALEIREGKEGAFVLALKTQKGDVCDVAPFDSRDKALAALIAVSRAMEAAQGHIRATNTSQEIPARSQASAEPAAVIMPQAKKKNEVIQWLIAIFGVLGVGVMFFYLTTLSPDTSSTSYASSSSVSSSANPKEATGVPVSADDFLSGL